MMKVTLVAFFLTTCAWNLSNACIFGPKKTCCPEVQSGFCFPPNSLFKNDPECPSTFSHNFQLFTRNQRTTPIFFTKSNIPSAFSNSRRTVFIVHGWRDAFDNDFVKLKDAFLTRGDFNVIGVEWTAGARDLLYFGAAANSESIGALIGATVNELRKVPGSNKHFWCVGHSLGAHACGFAAVTANPRLERITGMDPAGPSFGTNIGLTPSDAIEVDIIHTDSLFGSAHPRGDVDFYPNGGDDQPGCQGFLVREGKSAVRPDYSKMPDEERIKLMRRAMQERGFLGCSHGKAVNYMLNSLVIPSCYQVGRKCTSHRNLPGSCSQLPSGQKGVMGYNATENHYSGILYFVPSSASPHCTTN